MKTILIISEFNLLKAGTQALVNMVKYYTNNGFKVMLLTPRYYKQCNITVYQNDNLEIINFPTISSCYRKIGHITKFRKENISLSSIHDKEFKIKFPFKEKYDYIKYEYNMKVRLFKFINYYISTLIFGLIKINWKEIDLIIGYELFGGKAAKVFNFLFNKKLVLKYQGSLLYYHLFQKCYTKRYNKFRKFLIKTNADFVIMTNDGTKGNLLFKRLGFPEKHFLFVKNGYSVENVKKYEQIKESEKLNFRKSLNIKKDDFVILSISRLDSWKRNDRIIYSISNLLKFNRIKLIIVGMGSELQYLKGLCKYFGIENNVIFTGAIPHKDIIYYYSISDILIQYYDYSNLSNPVMEAFSYNKPIITLNDGSTDEFLIHYVNCFKVNLSNLETDTVKYVNLLKDKNEYKRIVNGIIKTKPLLNTWEERFKKETNIINKLI